MDNPCTLVHYLCFDPCIRSNYNSRKDNTVFDNCTFLNYASTSDYRILNSTLD